MNWMHGAMFGATLPFAMGTVFMGNEKMKDDLISRQAALDAMENCEPGEEPFVIKSLPSAQPEFVKDINVPTNDTISRQVAINAIENTDCELPPYAWDELTDAIMRVPSADVQPVRHGWFIGTEYDGYADGSPVFYEWKCSECGCIFEDDEPAYNYCPNCGARMDGEQYDIG